MFKPYTCSVMKRLLTPILLALVLISWPMSHADAVIIKGDMVFDDSQIVPSAASGYLFYQSTPWPNGVLRIRFDADVTSIVRNLVWSACNIWSETAAITCIPDDGQRGAVVIHGQQLQAGACQSQVGASPQGDNREMWLAWNCSSEPLVLHELGHLLGFIHEHQRFDRNRYISINTANIRPDFLNQFDILQGGTDLITSYDVLSIMHYRKNEFAIDSTQNTMTPLPPNEGLVDQMGNGSRPSEADGMALAAIYGRPVLHFTQQPVSVTVPVGQNAVFTVRAVGGTAPLNYRWETAAPGTVDFVTWPNQTTNSASLPITAQAFNGLAVRAVVCDSARIPACVTSDVGAVFVTPAAPPPIPPTPQTQAILCLLADQPSSSSIQVRNQSGTNFTLTTQTCIIVPAGTYTPYPPVGVVVTPSSITLAPVGVGIFNATYNATLNAGFVSQQVPTALLAGSSYTVQVVMRNTGTQNWTAAGANPIRLGSINPTDNTIWGMHRVGLATGETVAPGATKTFNFIVRAPIAPGTYNFQWKMVEEGRAWFGAATANVSVRVIAKPQGDYTGDGKTDFAVFRPGNGTWYTIGNSSGVAWGNANDIPVVGDYNGDGRSDFAVFRPSSNGTGVWYLNPNSGGVSWGNAADIPVPGDYNGDGKTDFAVFRRSNGNWYVYPNTGGTAWGNGADIPVPGDYNGDGKTDFAVFRPSNRTWYIYPNTQGIVWGSTTDVPVPGDYDGDGKTDIAVYRPSTGRWYRLNDYEGVAWGNALDMPTPGDFNGDGRTDVAVYRPAEGRWYVLGSTTTGIWGATSDIPVVNSVTTVIQVMRLCAVAGRPAAALEDPSLSEVTAAAGALENVRIYPNPWKANLHTGRNMTFSDLPSTGATIKLFTVSGHWIKTLKPTTPTIEWDLTNDHGDHVASGIYLYLISTPAGDKKTGQIVLIK